MSNPDDVVLKVSSRQDPGYAKMVAGAMSWRLREDGCFRLRAVKTDAVNTSIKAIAIVNQRVMPVGVTLTIDLNFAECEKGKEATAIAMSVHEVCHPRPSEFIEYKVSGRKDGEDLTAKLAGALAAPAREGKGVKMRCIGPGAVYRAIMASTIARGYIFPNSLEAIVVPTWDTMIGWSATGEPDPD